MLNPDCRKLFHFSEGTTYLDHGSYGVCPRVVLAARAETLEKIEQAPAPFFAFDYRPAWREMAALVARRFCARPEDVALVENVTDGINAVLRSLSFAENDEILVTSLAYGAVVNAANHVSGLRRARVRRVSLRFPDPDPQQCIDAVKAAITPRTKLAILDHVTSSTALILPVAEMTAICREYGVPVLVDGAHVPGNIALDIQAIGAGWYAANLHKWSFAPRGCGFLWAAPGRQKGLIASVLSWDIGCPFPQSFEWTGTRDPSTWLSIRPAFDFIDRAGEAAIRSHNHRLVRDGMHLLSGAWDMRGNTPDAMIGSMALVPLPAGLPFPATPEGCEDMRKALWTSHKMIVSLNFVHQDRMWLRMSAQVYNDISDYEKLADIVNRMRRGTS